MPYAAVRSFSIGRFDCLVVQDGTFAYPHPAETFFVDAPVEERDQALREHGIDPDDWKKYVSPYPALVVDTGEHTVLIDTGAGSLAPSTGKLRGNLRDAGLTPDDIDHVLLTHAHPDHIGGCVDEDGGPAFPDARYVISEREWQYWTSEPDLSDLAVPDELRRVMLEVSQQALPPLQDRLERIGADEETTIVPGVRALPAPGHTPGHIAVSIASEEDRLLHLADTVLHPVHLSRPEWHAAVDHRPEEVTRTRHRFLKQAAANENPVFVCHFPAPGLGHVRQDSGGMWAWQPTTEP